MNGEVGGMVLVLVQWCRPRDLLGPRVDRYRTDQALHRGEHLPGDGADRPVRCQWNTVHPAIGVLDDGVVAVQVQTDDESPRTIRGRERQGLPATGAEAQRGVLELGLRWCQSDRQ